jgi:uncharacterized protein YcbK (DUF882 family)
MHRVRPRLWRALLVLGLVLGASPGDAAPPGVAPIRSARIVERSRVSVEYPDSAKTRAAKTAAWAVALRAVDVRNRNTNARAKVRLYGDDGEIDREALRTFMRVAATLPDLPDGPDGEVAEPLDPRLVQLVFRAAYHFGGAPIVIVSATRKGSTGKHGNGDALDFQLDGVKAPMLAAYTRAYPRAGVGIYTHPKTQFVHVDVRDQSYHWIDASPPGVTWREAVLRDPTRDRRDAAYVTASDLPEGAGP